MGCPYQEVDIDGTMQRNPKRIHGIPDARDANQAASGMHRGPGLPRSAVRPGPAHFTPADGRCCARHERGQLCGIRLALPE